MYFEALETYHAAYEIYDSWMQWFKRLSNLNGLNARVDVNCGRKDGRTDGKPDAYIAPC